MWFVQRIGHAAHIAPAVPQRALVVPTRHTPVSSQQPVGHETASQVHAPCTQ
jgi:hypothetical protein